MEWFRESRFIEELPPEVIDTMEEKIPSSSPFASSPKPWQLPRKKAPASKPFFLSKGKDMPAASSGDLGYGPGDTVKHVKFGIGVVKEIRDGGRDKEVTVEFDNYGVKKMFAGFARLVRV
jgi:DNA helicase-2/ATP-dependent DNA helicase PcrA